MVLLRISLVFQMIYIVILRIRMVFQRISIVFLRIRMVFLRISMVFLRIYMVLLRISAVFLRIWMVFGEPASQPWLAGWLAGLAEVKTATGALQGHCIEIIEFH